MTNQEVIKMLTAKVECIRRETSGTDIDCNLRNCDDCELCYAQGTIGEQIEALCMAISALEAQEAKNSTESSSTHKALDTIQAQDVPDTNVGKMDGDELDEAIKIAEENGKERIHDWMPNEWGGKRRKLASWLCELKRLRTEVYFLKAEKENEPVDLLGDVPCKTCKWRVTTTEKCEECIDGVSDNYEVQEPCEDCVSRQAAIDAALSAFSRGLLASPDIRRLPSAQPERKVGYWLIREGISDAQCSECKMYFKDVYDMDNSDAFCRHCGAKMEGLKVVKDE